MASNKLDGLLLEELSWKQARSHVLSVNSGLAKVIDSLSPDESCKLFKVTYPYGTKIIDKGDLFLPTTKRNFITLASSASGDYLKQAIGYNAFSNPMTLVLKNTLDLFISLDDRIVNYSLLSPGNLFGLSYILESPGSAFFTPTAIWDMTAGARSIFMLPKITDASGFHELQKKYKIKSDKPQSLKDHWEIFRDIANHPEFNAPWEVDLLFFSHEWLKYLNDPAWRDFRLYLLDAAWKGSKFWRNQYIWDLTFSRIHSERGIKPSPYIADIVSHLLAITIGAVPGFRPALDDTLAPIKQLQRVFEEDYGIKYAPIIVEPAAFSVFEPSHRPVYYSFNYHTAIKMAQKSSNRSSVVTDIYQVRALLLKYMKDILSKDLNVTESLLPEMIKAVGYDFFHHDVSEYTEILSSVKIFEEDASFKKACSNCRVQEMPKNPPFLNGCVRIKSDDQKK